MDIRICVDRIGPPAGRVYIERTPAGVPADAVPFSGWLGLLKVLEGVLGSPGAKGVPEMSRPGTKG